MSEKRTFDVDLLLALIDGPKGFVIDGHRLVAGPDMAEHKRWGVEYEFVFADPDGRYWRSTYEVASGDGDYGPYEHDAPVAVEVFPTAVTTITYSTERAA